MFENGIPADCVPGVTFEFVNDVLQLRQHALASGASLVDRCAEEPLSDQSLRSRSSSFADQFLDSIQEWEHDDGRGFYTRYADWFVRGYREAQASSQEKNTRDHFFLLEMRREECLDADWVALLDSDELGQIFAADLLPKSYGAALLEEGLQEIVWAAGDITWKVSRYKYEEQCQADGVVDEAVDTASDV